jgi:hypothetical protein
MRIILFIICLAFTLQPQQVFSCGDEHSHPTKPVFVKNSSNDVGMVIEIDACIAPVIEALQKAGIYTLTSCCGHGKEDGYILLENGGLTVWKERARDSVIERYKKDFQTMSGKWDVVHQSKKKKADTMQQKAGVGIESQQATNAVRNIR